VNRVHAFLSRLGAAGVLGLGILFFCIPFYFSAVRPAELELAAQREAAERLRSRGPFRPVSADHRAEELRRFYGLFPAPERLSEELKTVYSLAREAKLELMQGEYRLEKRGGGPVAYRITLPVRGTYSQLRSFVDLVLQEMPIASVDALRFERKKIAETQVDAQVRLTLYFQPGNDVDTR
jgi:hypothetical protein